MNILGKMSELGGRFFIAAIFLLSGVGKIAGFAGTQSYMQSMGVPGALLPFVIVLEVGGALAIVAGFQTRLVAAALAAFTLLAALIFHRDFADQMQQIMFMKNVAITGGFLFLVVHGAGPWSLDARRLGRRAGEVPPVLQARSS